MVSFVIETSPKRVFMIDGAQIIRGPDGEPAFAVLPYAEYERLLDAADEAAAGRAYDAYKATGPETCPDSVAERLVAGESPVKVFREYRGMTQKRIAEAAGINQACMSRIESGTRTGSLDVLRRIAAALNVDLDAIA